MLKLDLSPMMQVDLCSIKDFHMISHLKLIIM